VTNGVARQRLGAVSVGTARKAIGDVLVPWRGVTEYSSSSRSGSVSHSTILLWYTHSGLVARLCADNEPSR